MRMSTKNEEIENRPVERAEGASDPSTRPGHGLEDLVSDAPDHIPQASAHDCFGSVDKVNVLAGLQNELSQKSQNAKTQR